MSTIQKWRHLSTFITRSSLIHFACIGVTPLILSLCRQTQFWPVAGKTCGLTSRGGANPTQVRWIKLDLSLLLVGSECNRDRLHNNFSSVWVYCYFSNTCTRVTHSIFDLYYKNFIIYVVGSPWNIAFRNRRHVCSTTGDTHKVHICHATTIPNLGSSLNFFSMKTNMLNKMVKNQEQLKLLT